MKQLAICILSLLGLIHEINAQTTLLTTRNYSENLVKSEKFSALFRSNVFEDRSYLYIKFSSLPNEEAMLLAKKNDIRFLEFIPTTVYLLSIPNTSQSWNYLTAHGDSICNIVFENSKFSDRLIKKYPISSSISSEKVIFYAYCQNDISVEKFAHHAMEWGEVLAVSETFHRITMAISLDKLLLFSSNPMVKIIDLAPPTPVTFNVPGKTTHRSSNIGSLFGRNLQGDSVVLGEWDGEGVGTHVDIDTPRIKRMSPYVNNSNGAHATHVCGTMAGAGLINPYALGMAPKAKVFSWNFYGDITGQMDSGVRFQNVLITQNSYGYGDPDDPCPNRGVYDDVSHELDLLVRIHPELIHVFAAGNSQSLCGLGGFRTVFSGFQSAKNIISVGALNDQDAMSSFSSWGPVRDGRLKPEVCAVGVNVYSTQNSNLYAGGWNGTSMACPGTSGTIAQLVQRYHQLHSGVHPQASLIRVILANTADDILNAGPDFKSGFGRINALTAVKAMEQSRYKMDSVSQGTFKMDSIFVPFGLHQLKIALAWSDKEAAILATKALVNNLDLYLVTPLNDTVRPWILDTLNRNSLAVRGIDLMNNLEQITINAPDQGYYKIYVQGTSIPFGPQTYAYTYEPVAKAITMIFPNGGELLIPAKSYTLKWDANGVGSTCNLEYSLNNGSSWTSIVSGISVALKNYNWGVPATNTSLARIRITAGSYSDVTDSTFSILAVVDSIKGVVCDRQVTLKWKKIGGATQYEVMMLKNGSMQSVGATIDTFFTVQNLVNNVKYWLSVRSKFNNAFGERAIAVAFTPGISPVPPSVTRQPVVPPVCSGTLVTLKAKASGTPTIIQQWQVSIDTGKTFINIPLATDTVFSFVAYTAMNNYKFRSYFYNSCQNFQYTDTVTLHVDTTLSFTQQPLDLIACAGTNAQFQAFAPSNSIPLYQWQYDDGLNGWLDLLGDSTPTLRLYTISYSSNGWRFRLKASNACTMNVYSSIATLKVNAPLNVTAVGSKTICYGTTTTVSALSLGGDTARYGYEWSLNGTLIQRSHSPDLNVTPLAFQTYKVMLWDSCSPWAVRDSDSVSVNVLQPLSITATTYVPLCKGNTASLTAAGAGGNGNYTYGWLVGNTLIQYSKANSISVTPAVTTTYRVFVTDSCTLFNDTSNTLVYVRPALHVVQQTIPDTPCIGAPATITAVGSGGDLSYTYTFIDENTKMVLQSGLNNKLISTINTNNNYIVVLNDSCTAVNDTLRFKIPMRNKLSLTTSKLPNFDVCGNTLVQLSSSPNGGALKNYTFQWRKSGSTNVLGTNKLLTISTPITSRYIVTLNDGCTVASVSDSITVVVETPNPIFSSSYTNGQDYAFFFALQPGYKSYQWNFGDGDTTSEFQPNHRYKKKGSYNVCLKVSTFNNCDSEYCQTVIVYFNNGIAGRQVNGFHYSPNPFSNKINLKFDDILPLEVKLFDALGREVEINIGVQKTTVLNTVELASGNYVLKVIYKDSVNYVKLIKR